MTRHKAFLVASLVLLLSGIGIWGCGTKPTPTPDFRATRTKEAQDYFATMTSQAGEPTLTPTHTPIPTPTCAPTTYVVQAGDTLARIAARYGTTADAICALNELDDCNLIHTGQELLIPCEVVTPTPSPTATPTSTPTPSITPTPTPTPTTTPTFTPTPTATPTPTPTPIPPPPPPPPPPPGVVSCEEAKYHVGEFKTVQGLFYCSYRPDVNGQPTFCNCPRPYPQHDFTALIWGEERPIFESCLGRPPETLLDEQEFGVNGLIVEYGGKPQIILTKCDQLREKQ